ncbi:SDR family oxidoreductase [Patescibacteria group bacterium]|nr:SDR family oxidoreductase [Patescibacteria group bacterium]
MNVVTGAAGHIGNVLCRELLKKGEKVRAVVLPGEDTRSLDGLDVEKVEGDILDKNFLKTLCKDVNHVYHLAAIVSITRKMKSMMEKVNVEGTRNIIEVCKECNVQRLIYTSSIHAFIEPPKGTLIDEAGEINPQKTVGDYAKTKAQATLEVLKAAKNGLDAVIVCPSGVMGPFDYRPSEMGQLFIDFAERRLKAYVEGAYDFVDVRDIAHGHILAAEKGNSGEIYIMSGELISITDILHYLEEITGVKAPWFKLQYWFAWWTEPLAQIYYTLAKQRPLFTRYSLYTLTSNANVNDRKAREELGYTSRPLEQSIKDTVMWLTDQGMLIIHT